MKTIEQIKKTWEAARLWQKDILVAKALGCNPIVRSMPKVHCSLGQDFVSCSCKGLQHGYSDNKIDGYTVLYGYTIDPDAALQAMKDVGMEDESWGMHHCPAQDKPYERTEKYYISWYQNFKNVSTPSYTTFAEACAFVAYAFSELKQKEGTENDEG